MDFYPQRVRANILPLSLSQALPEAFREWRWTGKTFDHGKPTEDCELCDQRDLRYHFEIRNDETSKTLEVGSSCILKFQVGVYEGSRRLSTEEAQAKLHAATERMHRLACIRALESVVEAEPTSGPLAEALSWYKSDRALSPALAFVLLWRLQFHKIDHDPSFFRVSQKTKHHREQLDGMSAQKIAVVWKALDSGQKKAAIRRGVIPPVAPVG